MGRIIGILLALLPFTLAWGGPLLAATGQGGIAERIGGIALLRILAWGALLLGGFLALLNVFLAFVRPLILQSRGIPPEEQRHVSGFPIVASVFLMLSTLPFFPQIWPCIAVTVLLLLDTGGPLWFLICTWQDDSLWTNKNAPTNKSSLS